MFKRFTVFFDNYLFLCGTYIFCVAKGTEEKGVGSSTWPPEAVGLVPRTGADDINSLESGDWPIGQDGARRVKR